MRRDVEKDMESTSFAPMFATLFLLVCIAMAVLFLYCNDIVKKKNYIIDTQVLKINEQDNQIKIYKEINDKQQRLIFDYKNGKMASEEQLKYKIQIQTLRQNIDQLHAEAEMYEEIQNKSNMLIKKLMKKLGEGRLE